MVIGLGGRPEFYEVWWEFSWVVMMRVVLVAVEGVWESWIVEACVEVKVCRVRLKGVVEGGMLIAAVIVV